MSANARLLIFVLGALLLAGGTVLTVATAARRNQIRERDLLQVCSAKTSLAESLNF